MLNRYGQVRAKTCSWLTAWGRLYAQQAVSLSGRNLPTAAGWGWTHERRQRTRRESSPLAKPAIHELLRWLVS